VPFSCTVVVPYELVWVVGLYLFSPNFVRSMTSWSREYRFHSSLIWFSILIDLVRCGLIPLLVWCLLCSSLYSHRLLGQVDQRKANLVFFSAQTPVCLYLV
jgi:hypothetical protein